MKALAPGAQVRQGGLLNEHLSQQELKGWAESIKYSMAENESQDSPATPATH